MVKEANPVTVKVINKRELPHVRNTAGHGCGMHDICRYNASLKDERTSITPQANRASVKRQIRGYKSMPTLKEVGIGNAVEMCRLFIVNATIKH